MISKNSHLATSTTESRSNKQKKYEYNKLFRKGFKISYSLFFLNIVFFVAWILGHAKESILILNSSSFSSIFFFLNPHVFQKVFIEGYLLTWLQSSVNLEAFTFLICYLITIVCFISIVFLAILLFITSYHTSQKQFHIISCLSLIPIVSWFFLTWFILKISIYLLETKFKKTSRFDLQFQPEKFEDIVEKLDPYYLATRPLTDPFDYKQYKICYKKEIKKSVIKDLHDRLESFLK